MISRAEISFVFSVYHARNTVDTVVVNLYKLFRINNAETQTTLFPIFFFSSAARVLFQNLICVSDATNSLLAEPYYSY